MPHMNQHVVYFVGGPMDLTKKVYPGQAPERAVLEVTETEPAMVRDFRLAATTQVVRHQYWLEPLRTPAGQNVHGRVFSAVWQGKK